MSKPFLTACWKNVCLFTYAVPPEMLRPQLPLGLELDLRDGQAFVSVVAFQFLDTRVWGIGWPGCRNFGELNLRYYVRHGPDRGVVFLREFAPQRLVAWVANTLYHERYVAAPITHSIREDGDRVIAEYTLRFAGRIHSLAITGRKPAFLPAADSTEHFFKEHHRGFGADRTGRLLRYQVEHPVWHVYPVEHYDWNLDWSSAYGAEWQCLEEAKPYSVVFAIGSNVAVYSPRR
jgi:hypothetical protein